VSRTIFKKKLKFFTVPRPVQRPTFFPTETNLLKTTPLPLNGLILIEPRVFRDARGHFFECFSEAAFSRAGLPTLFAQDNVSRSLRGTVRGLHYQKPPHAQGKLVSVLEGNVFDVAVDLRQGSPTFGRWHGEELSGHNARALYIPPGFAHGFCVTSEFAVFFYKCTAAYAPIAEGGIRWNDPTLNIRWPSTANPKFMSEKDLRLPPWREEEGLFTF
jgi:dTDP-4-dehydrorhamnose 3,5-epimerase